MVLYYFRVKEKSLTACVLQKVLNISAFCNYKAAWRMSNVWFTSKFYVNFVAKDNDRDNYI